jgi:predicted deacetylase
MNWEQWGKAKQMMDEAGVKAMLGVVPDCTDPDLMIEEPREDFWDYIKGLQEQGYAIAMHGYHHQFELKADGLVTRNKISEFAGLPYETQLDKIKKGKEILNSHGIGTDIFFAPAHSYDDNTLRALATCGFKYLSDGLSNKPYKRQGITLLPCRSGGIPKMRKNDTFVTAVVHAHEWVRKEKAGDWIKFKNLIENHAKEILLFEDFRKWTTGYAGWQRITELGYMFLRDTIVPMIRTIKK